MLKLTHSAITYFNSIERLTQRIKYLTIHYRSSNALELNLLRENFVVYYNLLHFKELISSVEYTKYSIYKKICKFQLCWFFNLKRIFQLSLVRLNLVASLYLAIYNEVNIAWRRCIIISQWRLDIKKKSWFMKKMIGAAPNASILAFSISPLLSKCIRFQFSNNFWSLNSLSKALISIESLASKHWN